MGHSESNTFVRSVPRFWLPAHDYLAGLMAMGAKYLPTIKDIKASQRFQQKQNPLRKFKKMPSGPTGRKSRGK